MTDRIHALTVVLEHDIRDDDVEVIVHAIEMIRGVASVATHVTDQEDHSARRRVRSEWRRTLFDVFEAMADGRTVTIGPRVTP